MCRKTLRAAKPPPYPQVPITPGDHIRKRRLDSGLLQKEVAAQLGVSESTVHHWETGKTSPALRFVPRIIEFLGHDPYPAPNSLPERLLTARRRLGLARRLGLDEETLVERFVGDLRRGG